jgi:hypothetical protein
VEFLPVTSTEKERGADEERTRRETRRRKRCISNGNCVVVRKAESENRRRSGISFEMEDPKRFLFFDLFSSRNTTGLPALSTRLS